MNEGIEVLQQCFSGERFSYHGKRYQFEDVKITPGYVQQGGPPLWIAAMSEAGALRAAHYNTNFLPQGVKAESYDPWVNALQDSGRNPDDYRVGIIRSILVTDDKAKDWAPVRASERYRMQLYRQFFEAARVLGVRENRYRKPGLLAMLNTASPSLNTSFKLLVLPTSYQWRCRRECAPVTCTTL